MEPPLRHLPTLRQLLMLLAFACVLPMAALSLAMVVYQYQHERRHTEATAIGTARALMAAVDDRLDSVERSLQALANSPALDDADYAALREEALQIFQRVYGADHPKTRELAARLDRTNAG